MVPTTRQEFKEWCLRKLGYPVDFINVSDDQVEDRIDEALSMWKQWHFDATERVLISHKVTAEDRTNKYITLDDNIWGVSRLLPLSAHDWGSFFSFRYQFMLNEVAFAPAFDMLPYFMAMTHINALEDLFEQKAFMRFNRHDNKLYIDTNWDRITKDSYIVLDAMRTLDTASEAAADIWQDYWLQQYAVALIKRQWGQNLSKYAGTQLLGGSTLNGPQIYDQAEVEITKLEQQLKQNYTYPPIDFMAS